MRTPQQIETMFPVSDRSVQRFPRLNALQLETVKRFGREAERHFAPDELLFDVGESGVPPRRVTSISWPPVSDWAWIETKRPLYGACSMT